MPSLRVENALEALPGRGVAVALRGHVGVAGAVAGHAGAANDVGVAVPVVRTYAAAGA